MAESVFHRILVPTDFSPQSERAGALARRLALAVGAEIVLVHVFLEVPLFSEGPFTSERVQEVYAAGRVWVKEQLEQQATAARAAGLTAKAFMRTGIPHQEIVAAAREEKADLIVMGTHGRGGVGRMLLGSVADRVIQLAPCPVLAVREPE